MPTLEILEADGVAGARKREAEWKLHPKVISHPFLSGPPGLFTRIFLYV
jgi:hypothetical protein